MVSYSNNLVDALEEFDVLILIVVEDGLVPFVLLSKESKEEGLNPCCSGRWSRTIYSCSLQGF